MVISNKKEPFLLLAGDLLIFAVSLWISLVLRNGEFPAGYIFKDNLLPFSILFFAAQAPDTKPQLVYFSPTLRKATALRDPRRAVIGLEID